MLHLFSEPNKYRSRKPGLVLSVQFSCPFGFSLGRTKMKGDLNFDIFFYSKLPMFCKEVIVPSRNCLSTSNLSQFHIICGHLAGI